MQAFLALLLCSAAFMIESPEPGDSEDRKLDRKVTTTAMSIKGSYQKEAWNICKKIDKENKCKTTPKMAAQFAKAYRSMERSGSCLIYGIDFNSGGNCDAKYYQNIQSPRQCFIQCMNVPGFKAWSWLTLDKNHGDPGQCTCKTCTTPIKAYNYRIAGYSGCTPAPSNPCFLYGQTWCNIRANSCKFKVFKNYQNPESCIDNCLRRGYKGFSWSNNQSNNPTQRKCYCFKSPYNPESNFFFISGKLTDC